MLQNYIAVALRNLARKPTLLGHQHPGTGGRLVRGDASRGYAAQPVNLRALHSWL